MLRIPTVARCGGASPQVGGRVSSKVVQHVFVASCMRRYKKRRDRHEQMPSLAQRHLSLHESHAGLAVIIKPQG